MDTNLNIDKLSEQYIREHCHHCDRTSQAFIDYIDETENFYIVCDHHPLVEGHILLIPKEHLSCIGEFSEELFEEFQFLYNKVFKFVQHYYGEVSTFEHGKIGQTVFHSHIHLLPFSGNPEQIVPEGIENLKEFNDLKQLKEVFEADQKYLFFSIGNKLWLVDTKLGAPRFFRDRFAKALGNNDRGDWKSMHNNEKLMEKSEIENTRCIELWHEWDKKNVK
jgi:diadenosine tetraphosphate (Ap4A) HIT family hydrolase